MQLQNFLKSGWKNKFLLEIVVFVSGALVMIFEIIGSRISRALHRHFDLHLDESDRRDSTEV